MLTTNHYQPPASIPTPTSGDDLLARRVEEFNTSAAEYRTKWQELQAVERDIDSQQRSGIEDYAASHDFDRDESVRSLYRLKEELIVACAKLHSERTKLVAESLAALRTAFTEAESELETAIETVATDLADQGWTAESLDGQALAHSRSVRGFVGMHRRSARERLFETVVVRSHPDVAEPRDRVLAIRKRITQLQASDNTAEQLRKLSALRRSVFQAAARDGAVAIAS